MISLTTREGMLLNTASSKQSKEIERGPEHRPERWTGVIGVGGHEAQVERLYKTTRDWDEIPERDTRKRERVRQAYWHVAWYSDIVEPQNRPIRAWTPHPYRYSRWTQFWYPLGRYDNGTSLYDSNAIFSRVQLWEKACYLASASSSTVLGLFSLTRRSPRTRILLEHMGTALTTPYLHNVALYMYIRRPP